uniref:Uncharacterized protein n=1 Tax=Parascaris univalens TaxID=6257 RepID=A0A915A3C7_PARUN
MTVIPSITGRIQGADFDATSKTLHIFKERDKAYALTLKGGKVKDYRPGLDLTDHFTGRTHGYSSAPHELPWQTDEGRQLKRDQKGIHLITDDGKRGKKSWVLATTSSDAVDYMMLFMPHTINPL